MSRLFAVTVSHRGRIVLFFFLSCAVAPLWFASTLGSPACALRASARQASRPLEFGRTMRVDYFHSGGPGGEAVKLDAVFVEGPWSGSRAQLVDQTNLGKYLLEVIDRRSQRLLYSRGFASIYGEWETVPEFRTRNRTFHESLRFPWPAAPVRVSIKKRDVQNVFQPLWTHDVDPRTATPTTVPATTGPSILFENGPPERKVDLLLISEGYSIEQASTFRADASRLVEALFALEPFKSRRGDFNVRTLAVRGAQLSVQFNIFGLERYALTNDNRALRNLAAAAPYDVLEILVNETKYGGGGIFNQQSTVAASNESSAYVFVHELAHNLAGLGDEYVGTVTYETGAAIKTEPWEPNITALHDPSTLKWRDLVQRDTPVPTPMSYAGKVGAFEGAGYEARGLYRPEAECIMGSRTITFFCRVCQRAINRVIDLHTR
jgi:IgA peptidase M64/peptidase M64-like protein